MKIDYFSAIASILFLIGLIVNIVYVPKLIRKVSLKNTDKKCECIDYSQFAYAQAKYELYVDSISYGNKNKRDKYADSIIKYSRILKQND